MPIDLNAPERGYAAIDLPAFAEKKPIVLAVRLSDAVVVALSPAAARELWSEGLLRGWEPYGV